MAVGLTAGLTGNSSRPDRFRVARGFPGRVDQDGLQSVRNRGPKIPEAQRKPDRMPCL